MSKWRHVDIDISIALLRPPIVVSTLRRRRRRRRTNFHEKNFYTRGQFSTDKRLIELLFNGAIGWAIVYICWTVVLLGTWSKPQEGAIEIPQSQRFLCIHIHSLSVMSVSRYKFWDEQPPPLLSNKFARKSAMSRFDLNLYTTLAVSRAAVVVKQMIWCRSMRCSGIISWCNTLAGRRCATATAAAAAFSGRPNKNMQNKFLPLLCIFISWFLPYIPCTTSTSTSPTARLLWLQIC